MYLILMTSASDQACDASPGSCTDDIRLLQRKVEVVSNDIAEKSLGKGLSGPGTTGDDKNTNVVKDEKEGRVAYPDGADENQDEDEVVDADVDLQEQVAVEQGHESVEHEMGAMESDEHAITTNEAAPYQLTRANVECKSKDVWIGHFRSRQFCADHVLAAGGTFFVFGKGAKKGWCYKESTSSASCPEGWENDDYDFFTLINPAHPPCRKSYQSSVKASRESRRRNAVVNEYQGHCHFPFKYKGVCYSTCATANEYRPWCYTDASFTTWGYCSRGGRHGTMFTGDCKTDKGFNLPAHFDQRRRSFWEGRRRVVYQRETSCVFPFKYDGTTYHKCTMDGHHKKWCYFQVDVNGVGVPGRWGHCKGSSSKC